MTIFNEVNCKKLKHEFDKYDKTLIFCYNA